MPRHRLRRLAGLPETIADQPEVNLEIERRLDTLPADQRGIVLDALELLQDAGPEGLLLQAWADQIRQLHAVEQAGSLLKTVVTSFPNVVHKRKRGHYVWRVARTAPVDPAAEADAATEAALHQQVALTSQAFALMRQRHLFTAPWLAEALHAATQLPLPVAHAFVAHLLTQFASMLTRTGDLYSLKPEPAPTRAETMAGLRDLTRKNLD